MSAIQVSASDWIPARIDLPGETVFAVGDIHGCADELKALLDTIAATPSAAGQRRRLVYLGDMIDRGPDNLGTLRLWAENEQARGVDHIDRLMGNHEQLLLLIFAGSPHAAKAETMWLSEGMGGGKVMEELRAKTGSADAHPSAALLAAALGDDVLRLFTSMQAHVRTGNLILVHGGLDPALDQAQCLAVPWTEFSDARWAWVHGEFLTWQGGFGGNIVVHGHTPPHKHFEFTRQDDPHELVFDRLGLDGGTTRTGIVAGAQIETGRYRVFRSRREEPCSTKEAATAAPSPSRSKAS
jgi:serine/threonine protein phosphatase 1